MIGFLLFVGIIVGVVGVVALAFWWIDADDREARQHAKLKAIKEVRVSGNHQDLFLLVNDLVLLQERGYVDLFPDRETLARAKRILDNYRLEIGP